MKRWPSLTAWGMSVVLAGCASPQIGLANAPRLGGTGLAEERVGDVVANGPEACGRYGERGPLRGRVPPCPTVLRRPTASMPAERPTDGLVFPWLRHFYVGWPCAHAVSAGGWRAGAWASTTPVPATCPVP